MMTLFKIPLHVMSLSQIPLSVTPSPSKSAETMKAHVIITVVLFDCRSVPCWYILWWCWVSWLRAGLLSTWRWPTLLSSMWPRVQYWTDRQHRSQPVCWWVDQRRTYLFCYVYLLKWEINSVPRWISEHKIWTGGVVASLRAFIVSFSLDSDDRSN